MWFWVNIDKRMRTAYSYVLIKHTAITKPITRRGYYSNILSLPTLHCSKKRPMVSSWRLRADNDNDVAYFYVQVGVHRSLNTETPLTHGSEPEWECYLKHFAGT